MVNIGPEHNLRRLCFIFKCWIVLKGTWLTLGKSLTNWFYHTFENVQLHYLSAILSIYLSFYQLSFVHCYKDFKTFFTKKKKIDIRLSIVTHSHHNDTESLWWPLWWPLMWCCFLKWPNIHLIVLFVEKFFISKDIFFCTENFSMRIKCLLSQHSAGISIFLSYLSLGHLWINARCVFCVPLTLSSLTGRLHITAM